MEIKEEASSRSSQASAGPASVLAALRNCAAAPWGAPCFAYCGARRVCEAHTAGPPRGEAKQCRLTEEAVHHARPLIPPLADRAHPTPQSSRASPPPPPTPTRRSRRALPTLGAAPPSPPPSSQMSASLPAANAAAPAPAPAPPPVAPRGTSPRRRAWLRSRARRGRSPRRRPRAAAAAAARGLARRRARGARALHALAAAELHELQLARWLVPAGSEARPHEKVPAVRSAAERVRALGAARRRRAVGRLRAREAARVGREAQAAQADNLGGAVRALAQRQRQRRHHAAATARAGVRVGE